MTTLVISIRATEGCGMADIGAMAITPDGWDGGGWQLARGISIRSQSILTPILTNRR